MATLGGFDVSDVKQAWAAWDAMATSGFTVFMERLFHGSKIGLGHGAFMLEHSPEWYHTPTVVITASLAYLVFVVLAKLLSKGKPKRAKGKAAPPDALWLRGLVTPHNVFLVALSTYMSGGICWEAYKKGYWFWGTAYNPDDVALGRLILIFSLSKIYEYLDTVIMVLKGNMHQVSFLHVYHYFTVSLFWWLVVKEIPGGEMWVSSALNSFVHVIMYTYYLLASLSSNSPNFRRKYLWWGRYLTTFQMFQFVIDGVHSWYVLQYQTIPELIGKMGLYYMFTLLALFGNFYVHKYVIGGSRAKGTTKTKKKRT